MRRTEWLQETRKMRFEEAYGGWQARRLTQEEAARLLGVCERTFRRYLDRYEEAGLEGLIDKRLEQVSQRRAPVDEVLVVAERYRRRQLGWNVKHFYAWYQREGGGRSYSWVKNTLQTLCRGSGAPWMTSSVSSRSALWAPTTVCASKGSRCRSHRTGIAVTTSRRRCEYTVIQMVAWPSFTAHASWPIMMLRVDSNRTLSRPSRKSAATGRPGEGSYGLYPLPLPRL